VRKLNWTLGLGVLAFVLLGAMIAAAAGGISIVEKTTHTSGGLSSRTARCQRGEHVLGGGFVTPGIGSYAQHSKPAGRRGWKALARSGPGDASAFALCEPASARELKKVSNAIVVSGSGSDPGTGSVEVKCPRHWKVVSGGYAIVPPVDSFSIEVDKRTSARTWTVHGVNYGSDATLEAFALCEREGESQIKQRGDTVVLAGPGTDTAVAECPKGSQLVGGGFKGYAVDESRPLSQRKWKARWSPGGPGSITSYAECER
jgi:hypothetical protein